MRTVLVTNRSIYYKYAEVEVKVPDDIPDAEVGEWLMDNENEYDDRMDSAIDKAHYNFGNGLGNGMENIYSESEWKYDVFKYDKQVIGGHL